MTGPVLITGARAPVAIEIARSFSAAGMDVHLADSVPAHAARWSRPRFPVHRLPPPRHAFPAFRTALETLAAKIGAALIVPTCEEIFYVAAAAPGVPSFVSPLPVLQRLHSKALFMELAEAAGVEAPATRIVTNRADLDAIDPSRSVLKPEYSRFGAATLIRPDVRALRRLRPSPENRWVAQDYVVGEELCLWCAVHEGAIVAHVLYRPLLRHGRSAAYAFEAVDWPPALAMAERIAASSAITGHLAFDLIRTPGGRAVPIECNPRAISGVHLFDGDALARAIRGERTPSPRPGTRCHLGPAMTMLGLPAAVANGQVRPFLEIWRSGRDVIGDGGLGSIAGTLIDAGRFAALGLGRRRSPTRQTTDDIEWNGEPIE